MQPRHNALFAAWWWQPPWQWLFHAYSCFYAGRVPRNFDIFVLFFRFFARFLSSFFLLFLFPLFNTDFFFSSFLKCFLLSLFVFLFRFKIFFANDFALRLTQLFLYFFLIHARVIFFCLINSKYNKSNFFGIEFRARFNHFSSHFDHK